MNPVVNVSLKTLSTRDSYKLYIMKTSKEAEPIEVFSGTAWQAGMVKSLLENAEVEAFIKDGIMGTFNPWWTAPGGAGSVKVFVSEMDYDLAKGIVEEYENNLKENH
jgi:hypothetical protein